MALQSKVKSWLRTLGPSGTGVLVRDILEGSVGQNIVADGDTHTNSTDETTLASKDLGVLQAGDVVRFFMSAIVPDNNSTDTLTLKVTLGTETIFTTAALDVADGDIAVISGEIVIRTAGSSGTLVAAGLSAFDAVGTAGGSWRKASASEDLSSAVTLALTGDWSVAHADNQVNAEIFNVQIVRTGV